MGTEVVPTERRFRNQIPDSHRRSIDTRLAWLWNQRFGTVQQVWQNSRDLLDRTASTLILQAIFAKDLEAVALILQRIEGTSMFDDEIDTGLQATVTRV